MKKNFDLCTGKNRENADDDARMRDGGSRRSRSTSRHATPPRRGGSESGEEEIPVIESPTEYGPPAVVSEPEPHPTPDREVHAEEANTSDAIEQSLQEEADRMEKLVKELKQRREDAALVGDENEVDNLTVEISHVENLQLGLPRPRNVG